MPQLLHKVANLFVLINCGQQEECVREYNGLRLPQLKHIHFNP